MKTLLFELTINRGSAARVSIGRVLSIDTTEIIRVEFIEFIEFRKKKRKEKKKFLS